MSILILIVDDIGNEVLPKQVRFQLRQIKITVYSFLKIAMGMLVRKTNMHHHDLTRCERKYSYNILLQ